MYLIPSKKLIYLAQPRTGSTSLSGWLIRNDLAEQVHGSSWPKPWGDHHGVDWVIMQEKKERGWKVITHVRNHWDYAVSFYYEHHSRGDITFERFLTDEFPDMTWHRADHDHMPGGMPKWESRGKLFWFLPEMADHVLRFEDFPANLVPFLGEEILELENVNPSPRKCYQSYYTDATRAWVERRYWREIKEYNYTYGENDGEEREAEPGPLGSPSGDDR